MGYIPKAGGGAQEAVSASGHGGSELTANNQSTFLTDGTGNGADQADRSGAAPGEEQRQRGEDVASAEEAPGSSNQTFAAALPSSRTSRMTQHMAKMQQRIQMQQARHHAIMRRAQSMLDDRKRYGGRLNHREEESWSKFMKTVETPVDRPLPTGRLGTSRRAGKSQSSKKSRVANIRDFTATRNRQKANKVAMIRKRSCIPKSMQAPYATNERPLTAGSFHRAGTTRPETQEGTYESSVGQLPKYDSPQWDKDECDLTVGEVFDALREVSGDVEPYSTAYKKAFPKVEGLDEEDEGGNDAQANGEGEDSRASVNVEYAADGLIEKLEAEVTARKKPAQERPHKLW